MTIYFAKRLSFDGKDYVHGLTLPDRVMARMNEAESIKINFSRKDRDTRARLRVVTFKDEDFYVTYIPSLNLSGYGATPKESITMAVEVVLQDYLMSLIELPESQVMKELREYGWQRRPFLPKQLLNTQFLSTDKIAEDFNLPAETKFEERFVSA